MRRLPDGYSDAVVVARGGTATVYRAHEDAHDRAVAIKVINAVDDAVVRRFERERRAMGRLSTTPSVASIYSSGITEDGEPYLVMPYLSGGTIQSLVKSGPSAESEAIDLMVAVTQALGVAHDQGILHLDVKPSNILLDDRGAPYVADFGIAEVVGQTGEMSGSLMTPSYAPPERVDGAPPDVYTDVYGIGAVLYALLAGEAPFSGSRYPTASATLQGIMSDEPDMDRLGDTSERMRDLVDRCLAKEPSRRPRDAAAVNAELVQIRDGAEPTIRVSAAPPTITQPAPAPAVTGDSAYAPTVAAATTALEQPTEPGGNNHRGGRTAAWSVAAVVALAVGVVGGVVLYDALDDDPDGAAADSGPNDTVAAESTVASTLDVSGSDRRSARLVAGLARLRSQPSLDAPVLADVRASEDASIEVLGTAESGWYRVEHDGNLGWIFGAFVLPADEGLIVAQSIDGQAVVLRDLTGAPLEGENPSGNKVLITAPGEPLHEVLLPDGSAALVLADDVFLVGQ